MFLFLELQSRQHLFIIFKEKCQFFIDEENKNKYFNEIKVKHPKFLKK